MGAMLISGTVGSAVPACASLLECHLERLATHTVRRAGRCASDAAFACRAAHAAGSSCRCADASDWAAVDNCAGGHARGAAGAAIAAAIQLDDRLQGAAGLDVRGAATFAC